MLEIGIRPMIRCDLPAVLAIMNEGGEGTEPWDQNDIVHVMRSPRVNAIVAEHEDNVIGFAIYRANKRLMYVLNLAVAMWCRRLGVASEMLGKLSGTLTGNDPRIVLEVRESNLGAQLFCRDRGFRFVQLLRRYYFDKEDAYVMERWLGQSNVADEKTKDWPVNRVDKFARHGED